MSALRGAAGEDRRYQIEPSLENQTAELGEQLRTSNTLSQEESAQMLDQSNVLQQELRNYVFTQYVEESQMSAMRNILERQQKRSRNEKQQNREKNDSFTSKQITVQNFQKEVQRFTRSEASLQQQHAMQTRALTQERDQERLSFESFFST